MKTPAMHEHMAAKLITRTAITTAAAHAARISEVQASIALISDA
eukprot:gene5267-4585_t